MVLRAVALAGLVALVASTMLASSSIAADATYYVAPNGSDDAAGTKDAPFGTIWHGMQQLRAGHTLFVRGGVYTERIGMDRQVANGRPDARITVRNQPGERPVVVGGLDTGNFAMGDHWTIRGIDFTWDDRYGKNVALVRIVDGTGWQIRGSEMWGNRSYAALRVMSETPDEPADWSLVGNCIHTTHHVNDFNNDHNVYISNGLDAPPGRIERNVIFGAPNGSNIKVAAGTNDGGASNVLIRSNVLGRAMSNVLVALKTEGVTIERNLLGPIDPPSDDKFWYPNLRAIENTGNGNVARDNAAFGAHQLIDNRGSSTGIADGGGNLFPVSPQLDSDSRCDGFYPTEGSYRGYGAYAPEGSGDPIQRIFGTGREATSVEISQASFASGDADTVVVARSDNYPDALAGGPMARALHAPILLTPGGHLNSTVANEVKRLGAEEAVLLGGEAALSEQVRRDLEGIGVAVRRVEGANRFETAAAVATELAELPGTDVENAYVVEGSDSDPDRGWPDAVAVGSLAAQQARPILLVTTGSLPGGTRTTLEDLGVEAATIIGGEASVSSGVADAIASVGPSVNRIAGASRFETSREVAESAQKAGADPSRVWFATGGSFPDALAAGPAVAKDGGVLLLVPGDSTFLNAEATDWLDRFQDGIARLELIGGRAAISHAIEDKARYALVHQ